jgi:monofunctional biosynthetic peptidoglycan transglycosylase
MARVVSRSRPAPRGGLIAAWKRARALLAYVRGQSVWFWIGWVFTAFFGLILLYQLWIFLHVWWWVDHNPSASAFMEDRLDLMQEKDPDAELKHKWVAYAQIAPNLKRAVVAAEDSNFTDHEGFDWEAIARAGKKQQAR